MSKSFTYVEIDIPSFDSPPTVVTYRFTTDTKNISIAGAIPSLVEVKIDPAVISLGEDMGTRATITCTFRDHPHRFAADSYFTGSFWGKFRARYGLKLFGKPLRLIFNVLGVTETRNFIIDSTDGPNEKGEYKIIAKDILKFADGDKAQAPKLSEGFLNANIISTDTTATLAPAGIGNSSYPASGVLQIGGSEVCTFTRSGDTLTLTRGQRNTVAASHNAQDRVQVVLTYSGVDPSTIIRDLLVNYASVSSSYINLTNWQAEVSTYLSTVYTADIAEPTSVQQLVSELLEQVGLVMWWDSINQQIKLQVLRPIPDTADTYDGTIYLAGSLDVKEQPEKQLTQCYTYFAKINPLVNDDQINNYRSTSHVIDSTAESSYGVQKIKKIFSRWIPAGGRSVADSIGNVQVSRFRDPPRRVAFDLLRGSVDTPMLGVGYQVGGYPFQNSDGTPAMVGVQITSLTPNVDILHVEAEEISTTFSGGGGGLPGGGGGSSPGERTIIIDANINNVNMRTMHDSLFTAPVSGNVITCIINAGVLVGSTSTGLNAFNVGTWPAGVILSLIVNGRIQGHGGHGGDGAQPGENGGNALRTRQAITLTAGQIWGGGGGGGGGGSQFAAGGLPIGAGGGGGGAGRGVGAGGTGIRNSSFPGAGDGDSGTNTVGGVGGVGDPTLLTGHPLGGAGGNGGGPGLAGSFGVDTIPPNSQAKGGGNPGVAIDGISFVTFAGGSPATADIRGPQVN
jgi:hypothetical protein